MFALRSFVWGSVMGVALAVALRPSYQVRVVPVRAAPVPPVVRPPPTTVTVIDVAAGVPRAQLASLVQLEPDEHIVAVGDRATRNELEAGAAIAGATAHGFVELDTETRTRDLDGVLGMPNRRIVLLLH
jgi:hypothetical protein